MTAVRATVPGTSAWGPTFATEQRDDAHLPGIAVPSEVTASTDASRTLAGADLGAIASAA